MTAPSYQPAAEIFASWRDDLLRGEPPELYRAGERDLERFEIGPGLVVLIGGAPNAGKSALGTQLTVDALRLNPELRALICNVEMSPGVLLDRQLARLSGIDANTIRHRQLKERHAKRIEKALNTLESIMDRLCFVRAPYELRNVAAGADDFGADLLLLDYIQRIRPPGVHSDRRGSVDATMDYLRQFADSGSAVIAISALSRTRDDSGRPSYDGKHLGLASFRESSELEYGPDDAFILVPGEGSVTKTVTVKHVKSRYGEKKDFKLRFRPATQCFESIEETKR